ncbi:MAG: hypothetical protein MR440_02865 [Firmicutes bacterium]|nr:hypothetical protein [Bacillota bacterium]
MFTQKRKNYKTFIFVTIIFTLCLLIIAIAWPSDPEIKNNDDPGAKANSEQLSQENKEHGENKEDGNAQNGNDEDSDWDEEDNFPPGEKTNISNERESYYLVKRAGDVIKVFFVDHSGNEVELETTSILYDMLSFDDQALFEEGYKVKTQEELAVLLQDFES